MIRLDQSYSDYTDETDGAFPAGKAVNASNSESYDGTPILADMINDMHGARQAIFKEAFGSVDGMSGEPDNVNASDTLNAIIKLIEDPDEEHAALRGGEAHGATSVATPGQIVTRDEYGRAKVSDPAENNDIATKKYVDDAQEAVKSYADEIGNAAKDLENAKGTLAIAKGGTGGTTAKGAQYNLLNNMNEVTDAMSDSTLISCVYTSPSSTNGTIYKRKASSFWTYIKGEIDAVSGLVLNAPVLKGAVNFAGITSSQKGYMPVGAVYTQYPLQKAPGELFVGTWTDITSKYSGLFFRAAGTDASAFNKTLTVSTQSGTTLTFASGHGITTENILINTSNGERRVVTSVSGTTVTINSAFSSTLTTVLIGQAEGLPNITGTFSGDEENADSAYTGAFELTDTNVGGQGASAGTDRQANFYASKGETKTDGSLKTANEPRVYGNSNHVTPNNLSIRIWQRTS